MCNHSRQPSLHRSAVSSGRILETESRSAEDGFNRERLPRLPQHHASFVDVDDEDCITQVNTHEALKRERSYCFLGLLEIGNSLQENKVDLLSDQFSLLSSIPRLDHRNSDGIQEGEEYTPRKRTCRGLVRSQRSSHLQSLGSLSDCDDSTSSSL